MGCAVPPPAREMRINDDPNIACSNGVPEQRQLCFVSRRIRPASGMVIKLNLPLCTEVCHSKQNQVRDAVQRGKIRLRRDGIRHGIGRDPEVIRGDLFLIINAQTADAEPPLGLNDKDAQVAEAHIAHIADPAVFDRVALIDQLIPAFEGIARVNTEQGDGFSALKQRDRIERAALAEIHGDAAVMAPVTFYGKGFHRSERRVIAAAPVGQIPLPGVHVTDERSMQIDPGRVTEKRNRPAHTLKPFQIISHVPPLPFPVFSHYIMILPEKSS